MRVWCGAPTHDLVQPCVQGGNYQLSCSTPHNVLLTRLLNQCLQWCPHRAGLHVVLFGAMVSGVWRHNGGSVLLFMVAIKTFSVHEQFGEGEGEGKGECVVLHC